uniref:Uncharacterized protein n=1 Tax=Yersinia enterocolitica W22703 TaxID=913028 RepID=F4N859_YEREN|nr:unknown protein [Yersinia enterocolitica W22703]
MLFAVAALPRAWCLFILVTLVGLILGVARDFTFFKTLFQYFAVQWQWVREFI